MEITIEHIRVTPHNEFLASYGAQTIKIGSLKNLLSEEYIEEFFIELEEMFGIKKKENEF